MYLDCCYCGYNFAYVSLGRCSSFGVLTKYKKKNRYYMHVTLKSWCVNFLNSKLDRCWRIKKKKNMFLTACFFLLLFLLLFLFAISYSSRLLYFCCLRCFLWRRCFFLWLHSFFFSLFVVFVLFGSKYRFLCEYHFFLASSFAHFFFIILCICIYIFEVCNVF